MRMECRELARQRFVGSPFIDHRNPSLLVLRASPGQRPARAPCQKTWGLNIPLPLWTVNAHAHARAGVETVKERGRQGVHSAKSKPVPSHRTRTECLLPQ